MSDKDAQEIMNATPEEVNQMLLDSGFTQSEIDTMTERLVQIAQKALEESPLNPKNKGLTS